MFSSRLENFCHIHQIQNCLQTLIVWKSLKFVVWEGFKKRTWFVACCGRELCHLMQYTGSSEIIDLSFIYAFKLELFYKVKKVYVCPNRKKLQTSLMCSSKD